MESLQRAVAVLLSLPSLLTAPETASTGDEEQLELSRVPGTIWNAVLLADLALVKSLCAADPRVIEQRGAVGEMPIHMCYLYNSPKHLELAHWIMNNYPHTLTSQYLGTEYLGENVLHIAIINEDETTVRELVMRGEKKLLTARATGRFFQHGGACYYGETPLAFSVCTNQPNIARFLLSHGADIECVDSRGNNLLHLMVLHNLPEMYSFVKEEFKRHVRTPACSSARLARTASGLHDNKHLDLWLRPNHEGLTPFCLAAKTNAVDMFHYLLQESKQTQWTFGPVSCDLYPLAELDLAIGRGGGGDDDDDSDDEDEGGGGGEKKERPGALELIMNAGNVELLCSPRMIDLVQQKWSKFAQREFHKRFRHVLAYLCLFSLTIIVKQTVAHVAHKEAALLLAATTTLAAGVADEAASALLAAGGSDGSEYIPWAWFVYRFPPLLWAMQIAVLAGAWHKGASEFREMWRGGFREYFSSSGSALLENTLSSLFCACIFLVAVLTLIGSPAQTAVLALASLVGWSYLFFFLLAFRLTGPMVVMIFQMLTNDVLRFLVIYTVFLMGFAQAFFVLFESVGWSGFVRSVQVCFVAMLGDFDLQQFQDSPYTAVSVGLLVVYVVTITILLLNLLIAMMGDTFDKINEAAEMQWHLERARIVFALENEMSAEEREDPANKYWTEVSGQRFLQVLEVNPDHFKTPKAEVAAAAKGE